MTTEWLIALAAIATLFLLIVTPILAWWGSSRYFSGVVTTQQEASATWRKETGRRLDDIEKTLRESSFAVLKERCDRLEEDIKGMHDWKHRVVDPYLPRAVDEHQRRLNRIEDKVFPAGRPRPTPL